MVLAQVQYISMRTKKSGFVDSVNVWGEKYSSETQRDRAAAVCREMSVEDTNVAKLIPVSDFLCLMEMRRSRSRTCKETAGAILFAQVTDFSDSAMNSHHSDSDVWN